MGFILESVYSVLSMLTELFLWFCGKDRASRNNNKDSCSPCQNIADFNVVNTDEQMTGVIRALRKNLAIGAYRDITSVRADQPTFLKLPVQPSWSDHWSYRFKCIECQAEITFSRSLKSTSLVQISKLKKRSTVS